MPIMTPVRTFGNFSGSFIDSVIGMISPMPSKVKTVSHKKKKKKSKLLFVVNLNKAQGIYRRFQ